jgi:hypothetical protein
VSSTATAPGAPFERFANGFGRLSAVLSALGLLVAIALSLPTSWWGLHHGSTGPSGAAEYTAMTPAAPVRVAVGGRSGLELVAPLVSSSVAPRQDLLVPPDDAPLVRWWSGSAEAGAPHGQTIVLAHAGATGGGLTQLAELDKGDFVDLLSTQGTMRYRIDSVRSFDPATLARVGIQLFKQDGGAGRLVLISAERWDGAAYQRSVVVTAEPLGEPLGEPAG